MKFRVWLWILLSVVQSQEEEYSPCEEARCSCNKQGKIDCRDAGIEELSDFLPFPDGTVEIDFANNQLTELKSSFRLPNSVEKITFSRNRIEFVNEEFFAGLKSLNSLDLSHNRLGNLSDNIFKGLNGLKSLRLNHNRLSRIRPEWFAGSPNLVKLDLAYNPLGEFRENLNDNLFYPLRELRFLDLMNCSLTFLPLDAFRNNTALTELRLAKNPLAGVPITQIYAAAGTLEYLDLSETLIGPSIPNHSFHGMYALKTLILNNLSRLQSIQALAFHSLNNLESFECQNNKYLYFVDPFAFKDHLELDKINTPKVAHMSHNALSFISTDLFRWNELEEISLDGNPWNCDCELRWMSEYSHLWNNYMVCDQPEKLRQMPVKELKAADFECSTANDSLKWIATLLFLIGLKVLLCTLGYALFKAVRKHRMSRGKPDLLRRCKERWRNRGCCSGRNYERIERANSTESNRTSLPSSTEMQTMS